MDARNIPIILFFLILSIGNLLAQSATIKFDQIGLEQGLSQSSVYAITQDKFGFMWFGTQDGLNRYDGYSITTFRHDPLDSNSISDNMIWSLLTDKNGDIWIGTELGGLNRYNPSKNKFYHYRYNENDTTTISSNYVITLYEDSRGDIWVGTVGGGLNLFDREKNKFRRFLQHYQEDQVKEQKEKRIVSVLKICEDNSGYLWVATTEGIYRLSLNDITSGNIESGCIQYRNKPSDPNSISNNFIRTIYFDRKETLWIGTWGTGLNNYDHITGTFTRYNNYKGGLGSIPGSTITSIYEESTPEDTYLWIGSYDGGLDVLNRQKHTFDRYLNEDIMTIYEDRSGIMWIGTFSSGVKILDRKKYKFKHYFDNSQKRNDLNNNMISSILEDRDGEFWVGTWGNGINLYDRERKKISNFIFDPKNNHSLSSNHVYKICESYKGKIWVATRSGGINSYDKKTGKFTHYKHNPKNKNSILSDDVSAMFFDEQSGILWIGYSVGGISTYDISNNTFQHFQPDGKDIQASTVTLIYKTKQSGLLIGTLRGGLYRFLPESNNFKSLYIFSGGNSTSFYDQQNNRKINISLASIYEDDKGSIWLGTLGIGLFSFEPNSDSLTHYTTKNGLPNDVVNGILPDKSGNLWLSTLKGLSRFNPQSKEFRNFDVEDGLQSNEFNQGAYFMNNKGELFFGGVNGFNAFFPEEIKENDLTPPVYFTSFRVFDKILPLTYPLTDASEPIKLSYSDNFFSFEFAALNYTAPDKNKYAYKLEGFDSEWHFVSAQQRYASYTNINPGEYILLVKASNNDGIWNEKANSISIIVTPPFWMTWWFRSLGIILLISIGYYVYQRRITVLEKDKTLQQEISRRLIEKQEEERKRIAQEMHDSLGQDLLLIKNRILLTMEDTSDNSKTCESLDQISENISEVLKSVRDISHNLRPPDLDRLGLTETLQSLLTVFRNSTNLKITGVVGDINGFFHPDLEINVVRIIQEALGNIIKHSEATECRVSVVEMDQKLVIEISDNGKGFIINTISQQRKQTLDKAETTPVQAGLGLIGMAERTKILGGKFEINSIPGKGTKIKVEIPINQTREN